MVSNPYNREKTYLAKQSTTKLEFGLETFRKFIKDSVINEEESLEKLIYGFEVLKLNSNGKSKLYIFFISDSEKRVLKFVSKGGKTLQSIDITKISQVDFGLGRGNFATLTQKNLKKYNEDLCISIFENAQSIDLIFPNKQDLIEFCYGISKIWQDELDEEINLGAKSTNIKQIWNKYDGDHSGKLEIKEFSSFLNEIKLEIGKKLKAEDIFRKVDSDKSGKIEYEEFVKFYEELTSANEFVNVFEKYSRKGQVLEISDLIKFMFEVQNETMNTEQAIQFILIYNKDMPQEEADKISKILEKKDHMKGDLSEIPENLRKNLHISLKNLQIFLIDNFANNAMNKLEQSMDYPSNDYFIYSSHNTYLKGHQLYGDSSVEMYAYAINLGCRCVELDCWDGKNNEPKITHGMTFTTDIMFKDALKIIKENAFTRTDSPFFLSIEMHCGDEQQIIMANYIQTILVDVWIPENDGIPLKFPSPNSLKGKFIVKCKRPKVIRSEETLEKSKGRRETKKFENNYTEKKKVFSFKKNDSVDDDKENMDAESDNKTKLVASSKNLIASSDNMILNVDSKKMEETAIEEKRNEAIEMLKNNKKTIKEVVREMYFMIGLISVELNIDKIKESNYQPWDVVSLSESKVNKLYETNREQLIEFTTNSFLRIYPKGTRIDSSNYDPVKSWICGAQLVSLNLQSLQDDFTIINHIFFELNNRTGYILKPNYLRNNHLEVKKYSTPAYNLHFNLLSGIMLQKCMNENSQEIYVTVNVIGTFEDDKNDILRTDNVKTNFLHPLFNSNTIELRIYEENLSFLMIKIFDNRNMVLARSVIPLISLMEGFRSVTLYNDQCEEIKSSNLIIFTKKY